MRLVEHDDEGGQKRALVLATSYGEEVLYEPSEDKVDWPQTPHVSLPEGQFNMDLNTLMFIAGQTRMPTIPKKVSNLPLGPCYNCSGDHLIRDCPYPRQARQATMAAGCSSFSKVLFGLWS